MKKSNVPKQAKYFKYKFTKLMIVVALAGMLLCIAGIGFSVYRLIEYGIRGLSDTISSPLLIGISVFCLAILISLLIKSQYIVTDEHYITQFGFIKSKFPIKDITSIVLDTKTNKLTIYVGEEYSVLSLAPEWNHEFTQALREVNPKIDYSFTNPDNEDKN
jgi:hypothetical protein